MRKYLFEGIKPTGKLGTSMISFVKGEREISLDLSD
jgi:hypothetical protein